MIVLMMLFGIYLFADEQGDIGQGTYSALDALLVAFLNLPGSIFELLPLGALIGSLLGLSNLARGSELTVIRAAGVSSLRLGFWAGATGVLLAAVAWFIGDYVAPPLQQYALQHKTFARFKEVSLVGDASAWAKDGNIFISVQSQTMENQFGGVFIYRFDEEHRLVSVARAAKAEAGTRWQLRDYVESKLDSRPEGDVVTVTRSPKQEFETNLPVDFLGLAAQEPQALPGRVLFDLMRHLHANDLDASQYEIAFWSRISRTVAVVFFVMLAVPFARGSNRSGSANIRIVFGVLAGVAFFLFAKTIESGAPLFNLPPLLVAWSPTLLLATITMFVLVRSR
jgi:lipopolysaccharide export system permease protein